LKTNYYNKTLDLVDLTRLLTEDMHNQLLTYLLGNFLGKKRVTASR